MNDDRLEVPHPDGGPRCSTGSAMRDESMVATASAGRRWLLVEISGGWGWSAFVGSPALDPAIGRALARRAEDEGYRILAIRRPGRARRAGRWRWAIVDTGQGTESIRWGEGATPDELLDAPFAPDAGTPSSDPIIVVCAHGRHDECCAVRGRRVAGDLAEHFPDWTWECSHMGGDRFAATMLLFPHGLNYGRVDHADAPALVDEYVAGRIAHEYFRGRTSFTRQEQAAQHAAMVATGDFGVSDLRPIRTSHTTEGWRVELLTAGGLMSVDVVERLGEPLYTMCTATLPVRVRQFEATAIQLGAAAL